MRVAIVLLLALLTFTGAARGQRIAHAFKGTCAGNISESDGVQARPANGQMSTKDYMALMKRARESHLKLGSDGFLWSTRSLNCDSVAIVDVGDYKGHTAVAFSNGDPANPIVMFAGGRVNGDGPYFSLMPLTWGADPIYISTRANRDAASTSQIMERSLKAGKAV
jgi:hypothetical protein